MTPQPFSAGATAARLVILFGKGGLSDVGRHAILAALEQTQVAEKITIVTRYPELVLQDTNWNCACPEPHNYSDIIDKQERVIQIVPIDKHDTLWTTPQTQQLLQEHVRDATCIVSCLGNRQPAFGHWESEAGNKALLRALPLLPSSETATAATPPRPPHRIVVLTSTGVEEDWPPMEFIWYAKVILGFLFLVPGLGRGAYRDLTMMERAYRATSPKDVDFLLVRPVGIGEEVVPVGKWWLQKEKYKDGLGGNMAKLDLARYMVQEALQPTKHRDAVVIGADPETLKK